FRHDHRFAISRHMEWIAEVGQSWLWTALWLAGFGCVFGILARLMPCNPGMYPWRDLRGLVTDAIYWFVTPVFMGQARVLVLAAGVVLLYGGAEPDLPPVQSWPVWVQLIVILLLED